jgi:photosystem II stability/assembly factor-like uncharacterized protein
MSLRRLAAPFVSLLLGLAGCATTPAPTGAGEEAIAAGAPFRAASKREAPKDGRKRDRATISAQYHLDLEADESGPPSAAQILRAQAQRESILKESGRAKAAGLAGGTWQPLGPVNIGGRVRSLAFDPRNARRLFAGTASGGLWISNDGGTSWEPNFDFLPNLSISTIVVDPARPDTMYLGTGEASAGLVGLGAFKSTDGGRTWAFLSATNVDANPDWRFVNRLAIHPAQTGTLLAAMSNNNRAIGAIYRSIDAGATWTRAATMKALDIAFDPNTPTNAVAGLDDGTIAYSRDAGATWTRSAPLVSGTPTGRQGTARAEIAFARSASGVVYASLDNNKGEVWKSVDAGATWTKLATPGHLNEQGDYDNAIWVDPLDANVIVVGGLDLYRSTDGGLTFTKVSEWRVFPNSPHPDHHALVSPPDYGPGNRALLNGNDGGVYKAFDILGVRDGAGGGWTPLNNGLAVTQFYSGAGRTAAGGRIIGGTQDNGSLQFSLGGWSIYRGGDGGFSAVDPVSDLTMYGSYVYLAIHRSTNGGASSQYICSGITEAQPAEGTNPYCGSGNVLKANFIAPFILDPNDSNRLLAGANSLWVTDGAKAPAPAWRTIKDPSSATDNFISAIAAAEGNGNVIWVGHNNGEVYATRNGLATVPAWQRVGQGSIPSRAVQRIMIDKDDPSRVIVAVTGFSANNVWETRDGGATWNSITANLPQAPVFDVKRHPRRADWLYAATSVGLYTSEDRGATWSTTNEGPANIRVRQLFWLDDETLGVATYGRGMFKATVPATGPASYQDLWWAGPQENGWGVSIVQRGRSLFASMYIYDEAGRPQWVALLGGTWNADFTAYTGPLYIPQGSSFAAYDPSRFVVGAPVGTGTLTFANANAARLDYAIRGVSGTKNIVRQPYGPADSTPVGSYADLWWAGSSQNGWGITISQQYRTLFAVWFTYDTQGRNTWFVVPGGTWTAGNVFSGTAYRTSSSPWVGVPYDPSRFAITPVGTVTFTFGADGKSAGMAYTIDGLSGSNALVRQPL